MYLQDNDLDWLTSKDPSMQPKLSSLKRMFPQISHAALQNMLVANEGCLNRTVRVRQDHFLPELHACLGTALKILNMPSADVLIRVQLDCTGKCHLL